MKTKWCASHMSIQIKAAFHIIQFSMIDFYRRFDWFLFCQTYRVAWWSRIFSCSFVIPKLHELKFWFRIPLDIFWDLLQRAVGKLTRATNDIHTKQKTLFDNVYIKRTARLPRRCIFTISFVYVQCSFKCINTQNVIVKLTRKWKTVTMSLVTHIIWHIYSAALQMIRCYVFANQWLTIKGCSIFRTTYSILI